MMLLAGATDEGAVPTKAPASTKSSAADKTSAAPVDAGVAADTGKAAKGRGRDPVDAGQDKPVYAPVPTPDYGRRRRYPESYAPPALPPVFSDFARRRAPPPPYDPYAGERRSDQVIFVLRGTGAEAQAVARQAGVTVTQQSRLASVQLVMVVARLSPGDTPEAAMARLSFLPGVAWAQADHIYGASGRVPPSPTPLPPEFAAEGLTGPAMARPAAGVVAMIDTPVAFDHEAFRVAVFEQRLFTPNPTPDAHGTAVASLLVGRGGVAGAGQGARLVSLAAFEGAAGDGAPVSETSYLARALDAAVTLRPNVLNLSFGGPDDRLLAVLLEAADARGVCVAAAAGNGGRSGRPPFPASHPDVLGVTAVDEGLRIYALATPGPQVAVAAMGVDLFAAAPGGYRKVTGTSFAAAVVSGALLRLPACALARDPKAMRAAVVAAARDLGTPGRDARCSARACSACRSRGGPSPRRSCGPGAIYF